jgi:hypothetical protein
LAPCDFYLFPQSKITLKGRHFHTSEVIEAKSQEMLNTITEHDFHAFKKWQKQLERCAQVHSEGDYFEGDDGQ